MNRTPKDPAPESTQGQRLRELIYDYCQTRGDFTAAEFAEAREALYGVGEPIAVSSEADASGAMCPVAVMATAWASGWELHIGGVGVTQSESVGEAETAVRDYLELDGLDRDAPLDITFKFRGRPAPDHERLTLLTRCVTIGCA